MKGDTSIKTSLIALFCILITSCAPFTQFSIQVLEPAEVTLPAYINSFAFINRSYRLDEETLLRNKKEISQFEQFVLDSAINNKLFEGLMTGIRESPKFGQVSADALYYRRTDTLNYFEVLDKGQLCELEKKITADALISLEYYRAKSSGIFYDQEEENWMASLEIDFLTAWSTYDLHTLELLDSHVLDDTLFWYGNQIYLEDAVNKLPGLLEAFREAAFANGYKYSRRIVPAWYDAERYLYCSGPKEMQQSAKLAMSGKWDDAGSAWEDLLNTGSTKTMAKASFNLAVKSESEDKLEEALQWANKSFGLQPEKHTMDYINLLLMRELKRSRLTKQIQGDPVIE